MKTLNKSTQSDIFAAIEFLCHYENPIRYGEKELTQRERLLAISYLAFRLSQGLNFDDRKIVSKVSLLKIPLDFEVHEELINAVKQVLKHEPDFEKHIKERKES